MTQILRVIAVLILSCIICQIISIPVKKGFLTYNKHEISKNREVFENNTAYDVLFIGSSRAHKMIYPKIIDSICNVSSYNAGSDGGKMVEFKMSLEGYLKHHPAPKSVVFTIDLFSFLKREGVFNYPVYYPFIDNEFVYKTLADNGHHVALFKMMPFMLMTELDDYSKENIFRLLAGKGDKIIPDEDLEYKGYMANTDACLNNFNLKKDKERMYISDEAASMLRESIDICRKHNAQIIFTYAPAYDSYDQKNRTNTDSVFKFINDRLIIYNERTATENNL